MDSFHRLCSDMPSTRLLIRTGSIEVRGLR